MMMMEIGKGLVTNKMELIYTMIGFGVLISMGSERRVGFWELIFTAIFWPVVLGFAVTERLKD